MEDRIRIVIKQYEYVDFEKPMFTYFAGSVETVKGSARFDGIYYNYEDRFSISFDDQIIEAYIKELIKDGRRLDDIDLITQEILTTEEIDYLCEIMMEHLKAG